jgi:hypothetical protein
LRRLHRFLKQVYDVSDNQLGVSAKFWDRRFCRRKAAAEQPHFETPMPTVTDLLATIDVLLSAYRA